MRPSEARAKAHLLAAELAQRAPGLVRVAGIDLSGGLEQQLFFSLRDGRAARSSAIGVAAGLARLLATVMAALVATVRRGPAPGGPLVLIREPVHAEVITAVNRQLAALGGRPLVSLRVGRAAERGSGLRGPRLADGLDLRLLPALAAHFARTLLALGRATRGWPAAQRSVAAGELPRIALGAVALASATRRWRPSLLVAFDEVGTWGRILPAVAARHGLASLDLPHAEVADADAVRGAGYDRLAVYGPRAATRLAEAGIDRGRIVVIGAPRFDALVGTGGEVDAMVQPDAAGPVVFAAQYVAGAMTAEGLRTCLSAAAAAAGALAPSDLVIVPHPAEPHGTIAALAAAQTLPPGVRLRIADDGLHAALRGARLLVTGWSNSVFEAALLGVPSISVSPGGVAPVDFAAEGLAIGVSDAAEAARAAAALLDPAARAEAVRRARASLPEHLGPLDGRAAERAARLVRELERAPLPAARPVPAR